MQKASAHVTVRHSRLIVIVLALLLALPVSNLHSEEEDIPEARHAWMGGYQAMNKADKAMEEHSELAALHDYQKALEIFQKVQRDYPRWNVSLLRFRVDYCRKQIEALKASNAHNLDFMTKEELLSTVNRQTEDLQAMREQIALQARELQAAQASLEKARAEAAQAAVSQENLRLLRQDRETLNAQVKLLTVQLATTKEDLQKARTDFDAEKQAETERQLTAIRRELEDVTRQLDATQKEKKRLDGRVTQYEKQLQSQEERLATAEKSAAAAKKSLENLVAENRQLQQEVTRLREKSAKADTTITGELPQLQAQLRNREEELRSAQMEVMTLRRKLTQAEENASTLGADFEAQSKRLQADSARLNEKIAEVETLSAAKTKLEAQLQENTVTLASHKELLAKLEGAAAQTERELAATQEQLKTATAAAAQLEEKLHSAEATLRQSQNAKEAVDGIAANAATLEQDLQRERADKELLAERVKTLEERIKTIGEGESDNRKLREQSIRDLEELVSLRVKTAALEQRLNASDSTSKETQQKLDALIAATNTPQRPVQELQVELANAKRRLQEMNDDSTLYAELQAAKARVAELEKASLEAPEKLRQALRRNADDLENLWSKRLKETESRMNAEVAKRQELEAALIKSDGARQALEQELLRKQGTHGEGADTLQAFAGKRPQDGTAAFASSAGQSATPLSVTDEIIMKGYLRQGVDAEQKGNLETAQWNYEQALKMQPDNPIALKRLGLIAANRGDDQSAANYLGKAFRLTPDDHEVLMGLGFAMIQLNQPLWALAGLSRAAALRPNDPEVMRLFGIALSTMRWQEAAAVQFKRTLQLKKDDAEAAFNLAMLELARSSELQQQARQDQSTRTALEALAAARRAQALAWYRQAVANGAQPDPELERALGAAPEKK